MIDSPERTEAYLTRAKELLVIAGSLSDEEARKRLLEAAEECMRLAEQDVSH